MDYTPECRVCRPGGGGLCRSRDPFVRCIGWCDDLRRMRRGSKERSSGRSSRGDCHSCCSMCRSMQSTSSVSLPEIINLDTRLDSSVPE